MPLVTDLQYPLETRLIKRLDNFAKLATRKKKVNDVVFTIHGKTGTGKTNTACVCAYYLGSITNRPINLFFRTARAQEFIQNNKEGIVIVDEPSLDNLSTDQMRSANKDFMRLLNTMRQKRFILIVCITRFWRFPFDLVVDRSLAMINMYNKEGRDYGRFQYIRGKKLERLWDEKINHRKIMFGTLKSFGGRMPERMETPDKNGIPYFNHMKININGKPNCTYDDYKSIRDQEISDIGEVAKMSKKELLLLDKIKKYETIITTLPEKLGMTQGEVANLFGMHRRTFIEKLNSFKNSQEYLEKSSFEACGGATIVNSMASNQENQSMSPQVALEPL